MLYSNLFIAGQLIKMELAESSWQSFTRAAPSSKIEKIIYVYSMCLADGEKHIFLRSAIRRALHKEGSRNQESSIPEVDPSRTARNKAGGLTACRK